MFTILPALLLTIGAKSEAPQMMWHTVHLQSVQLSDDDGSRQTPLDPKVMQVQVDWANKAFASAGIRFVWDPAKDIAQMRSTKLNRMETDEKYTWKMLVADAGSVAAKYPNRLLLLHRYGTGKDPAGDSFSGGDLLFVASCGSNGWGDRYWNLAHEISHNLSLPHPHGGPEFAKVADAEKYFIENGKDPKVFDGDGLDDTPAFPAIPSTYWDDDHNTITVCGVDFTIPRGNVPSYTFARDQKKNGAPFSPMQIRRMRWMLDLREKAKMQLPSNKSIKQPVEAENLKVLATKDCDVSKQDMAGYNNPSWSSDAQAFIGSKIGSEATWNFPVNEDGRYELVLGFTHAPDFGIVRVSIDGKRIGKDFDCWGPEVFASGPVKFGSRLLFKGNHKLKVVVVGKNPDSKGTSFGLDCVYLVPVK